MAIGRGFALIGGLLLLSRNACAFVCHGAARALVAKAGSDARAAPVHMSIVDAEQSRTNFLKDSAAALAVGAALGCGLPEAATAESAKAWKQIELPVATTLYDVAFDPKDPSHGFVVGAQGTFLETNDGGETWGARTFGNLDEEEEINYRFQKVSVVDREVFIVGKPPILLHSKDAGKSFERIPLSPKLPGEPTFVEALGGGKAEMTTSTGAVYYTSNAGLNWKAQVKETIDATLNRISSSGVSGASYFTGSIIGTSRDESGSYLAVSSRGNFYLTWQPGQDFWVPHNRGSARRIQNMGFVKGNASNGLWMTLNGGAMQKTTAGSDLSVDTPDFEDVNIKSGGFGIIDAAWKDDNEAWAVGGGGSLWYSTDGGKKFRFNPGADKIPGNLYNVKFFSADTGIAIGSDGVLLKYIPGQV